MNKPHSPEDAERVINDFLNDIEKCKKYLDIVNDKPETAIKELWELNEVLKKAVEATDKLKKKPYKVVKDFTDALIKVVLDLIEKGFELPIYMVAISHHSGSVMASRCEWDSKKEGTKIHVFVEHMEGGGWVSPVHCFFVDGRGVSESVKVELG